MKSPQRINPDAKFLMEVYHRLYKLYGPQHWWPGETDIEIIIGAILTQSTAWTNVEKAIANLNQKKLLTVKGLYEVQEAELAELIRPSGYFNQKAKKVKAFIQYLHDFHHGKLDSLLSVEMGALRKELLSIHGIGEETADSIILYASRQPSFVVDAYTRRIFYRLGCHEEKITYQESKELFTQNLPPEEKLFNEYHALIVAFGKNQCKKKPQCSSCPLQELCGYWKTLPKTK
jgi:endonuclease-3 related protein